MNWGQKLTIFGTFEGKYFIPKFVILQMTQTFKIVESVNHMCSSIKPAILQKHFNFVNICDSLFF